MNHESQARFQYTTTVLQYDIHDTAADYSELITPNGVHTHISKLCIMFI